MTLSEKWNYLEDNGYFTNDELCLATCLNGYNEQTINDCLYVRYGYRDFEQFYEAVKQN